jgi:hypothetical protein
VIDSTAKLIRAPYDRREVRGLACYNGRPRVLNDGEEEDIP